MVLFKDLVAGNSKEYKQRGDLAKKLIDLTMSTGYNIIQTNGQRVYSPSKNIPPPPKGCEVFIGKLSKYIYEDELIPLFETVGPLYQFRMMLDFSERTRGYAFATYFLPEHADKAVKLFNNYEIRLNVYIGVYKSVDNCRLFIGNLPLDKTQKEILDALQSYASGVVDVIMFQSANSPNMNRGFAFVEFENHRCAAMARRQFTPNNLILWDNVLYVDWADPLPDVDQDIMSKVTILYLSNLPAHYNSNEIRAAIYQKVSTQTITKVYKNNSYAFVHFTSRSAAEYGYAKLQNLVINNYRITVDWARPRCYSKAYRMLVGPTNFCTSVPPSLRKMIHHKRHDRSNSVSSSDDASVHTTSSISINIPSPNSVNTPSPNSITSSEKEVISETESSNEERKIINGPNPVRLRLEPWFAKQKTIDSSNPIATKVEENGMDGPTHIGSTLESSLQEIKKVDAPNPIVSRLESSLQEMKVYAPNPICSSLEEANKMIDGTTPRGSRFKTLFEEFKLIGDFNPTQSSLESYFNQNTRINGPTTIGTRLRLPFSSNSFNPELSFRLESLLRGKESTDDERSFIPRQSLLSDRTNANEERSLITQQSLFGQTTNANEALSVNKAANTSNSPFNGFADYKLFTSSNPWI